MRIFFVKISFNNNFFSSYVYAHSECSATGGSFNLCTFLITLRIRAREVLLLLDSFHCHGRSICRYMHACSIKNANLCQKYKTTRQKYVWAYVAYAHVTNPWNGNSSSSFCGRNVSCQISQLTHISTQDGRRPQNNCFNFSASPWMDDKKALEMEKSTNNFRCCFSIFCHHYYTFDDFSRWHGKLSILFCIRKLISK